VCLFTPLIMSLKGPGQKMSASIPGTHIKVHESEEGLKRLVYGAYCPAKDAANPIMEISNYVIFPLLGKLEIDRPEKFGGRLEYDNFEELKKDYKAGKLHPKDLKQGVFDSLNSMLKPVRDYFDKNKEFAKAVKKTYGW
jgi:tyrosyl-tRNA synthetase